MEARHQGASRSAQCFKWNPGGRSTGFAIGLAIGLILKLGEVAFWAIGESRAEQRNRADGLKHEDEIEARVWRFVA